MTVRQEQMKMNIRCTTSCRLVLALLVTLLAAVCAAAQTSAELRKKYGEPEVVQLSDGRPPAERYQVRPGITMIVTYTDEGQPCEMRLEPVPTLNSQSSLVGDLMPTKVVVEIINELAPVSSRGRLVQSLHTNGGDHEMKLNHPGCTGMDFAAYEHVTIYCVTWCQGGTFSVTIHWGEANCQGQRITPKRKGQE